MASSCPDYNIQGKEQEVDFILSTFKANVLTWPSFKDCPALEIPPSIRRSGHFQDLWDETSVLNRWSQQASLDAKLFPELTVLGFTLTNLTGIPEGLMDGPLPEVMVSVSVYGSNLTTLPETLHESWGSRGRSRVLGLSIRCIPDDSFQDEYVQSPALRYTPMGVPEPLIWLNDHLTVMVRP